MNTLINKHTGKRTPMTLENINTLFKRTSPVEKAAKELANQMLINNLMNQLATYKVAPLVNDVAAKLDNIIAELRTDLDPIKKALKFKINAEITQNWQDELKYKMKAKMALKGGTSKYP